MLLMPTPLCKYFGGMDVCSVGVPRAVVVLCGKRKSGKDHVAAKLVEMIGDQVCVLRLSKPLKTQYAKDHNLDIQRLMDSSVYKETYRHDMIVWSEAIRKEDPGYFCRLATAEGTGPVWLVCDARRESDMQYFKECHGLQLMTVRIQASEQVRKERGWVYDEQVDDAPSECGLDHYECDVTIDNTSACESSLTQQLQAVTSWVRMRIQHT